MFSVLIVLDCLAENIILSSKLLQKAHLENFRNENDKSAEVGRWVGLIWAELGGGEITGGG